MAWAPNSARNILYTPAIIYGLVAPIGNNLAAEVWIFYYGLTLASMYRLPNRNLQVPRFVGVALMARRGGPW